MILTFLSRGVFATNTSLVLIACSMMDANHVTGRLAKPYSNSWASRSTVIHFAMMNFVLKSDVGEHRSALQRKESACDNQFRVFTSLYPLQRCSRRSF